MKKINISKIIGSVVVAVSLFVSTSMSTQAASIIGNAEQPVNEYKTFTANVGVKYEGKAGFYYSCDAFIGVKNKKEKYSVWYAKIKGKTLEVYGGLFYGNPSVNAGDTGDPDSGTLKYGKHDFKLAKDCKISALGGTMSKSRFNKRYKKRKKRVDDYNIALTFTLNSKKEVEVIMTYPVG